MSQPTSLHPLLPRLATTGWQHHRTNCPCKGKSYHSVYRKGDAFLFVWWNLGTYRMDAANNSSTGTLAELNTLLSTPSFSISETPTPKPYQAP